MVDRLKLFIPKNCSVSLNCFKNWPCLPIIFKALIFVLEDFFYNAWWFRWLLQAFFCIISSSSFRELINSSLKTFFCIFLVKFLLMLWIYNGKHHFHLLVCGRRSQKATNWTDEHEVCSYEKSNCWATSNLISTVDAINQCGRIFVTGLVWKGKFLFNILSSLQHFRWRYG